jgi:putative DNA methylase
MIEIPPKFAGRPPINPSWQSKTKDEKTLTQWEGAQGLAEDVGFYGAWIRAEAEKRIGDLYPKIEITPEVALTRPDLAKYCGQQLTVVAWLWARTVKSPNPAFSDIDVPLVSSFVLSPMAGKEAYVEPIVENGGYRFSVRVGLSGDAEKARSGTKLARANFSCVMSGTPISGDYIKAQGQSGLMGAKLMAIVAEGERGRAYLAPTPEHEAAALQAKPTWRPDGEIATRMTGGNCTPYGLTSWGSLFTPRQLVALTTFSDLVQESIERIRRDAIAAGIRSADASESGDVSAESYANAVAVYLSFLVSKLADKGSSLCTWDSGPPSNKTASGRSARVATVRVTFGRQALPMTWDYAEVNFFSDSVGSIDTVLKTLCVPLTFFPRNAVAGSSLQSDAQIQNISEGSVVSTDPPYYDNIGYADLSDFFYVWLRRCLKSVYPELFLTLTVPKAEELVATSYRHGGKEKAEAFFLNGMTQAMHRLAEQAHPAFPVTIYYAFKQAESDGADGTTNTGWDTFLAAVIEAGFAISGTWPVRTELSSRMIGSGRNALASSIVLVCRQREAALPIATRREFVTALKAELPKALAHLQAGNIAPVDLAQAAIGPGMAIYTRYGNVLDAAGVRLSVRSALALINETLDDALAEQEGDFDPDTRWALTWFEQTGFLEGDYGVAEQLSKSKNTAVAGLVDAGILLSKAGKVRLLKPNEMSMDWDPTTDNRLTVWEMVHQLIRALEAGGESAASKLVAKLGSKAETARELCYRLYMLCERKKRTAEGLAYNALVLSWPEIARLASESPAVSRAPNTDDMFAKE